MMRNRYDNGGWWDDRMRWMKGYCQECEDLRRRLKYFKFCSSMHLRRMGPFRQMEEYPGLTAKQIAELMATKAAEVAAELDRRRAGRSAVIAASKLARKAEPAEPVEPAAPAAINSGSTGTVNRF